MASIYSQLIFEGHNLGGSYPITLDPAYVWIVRDVDWFAPGPDTDAYAQLVASVVGGTWWKDEQLVVPAQGYAGQWRGRQVFVPPATGPTLTLLVGATVNGPDVRISGYRLTPP